MRFLPVLFILFLLVIFRRFIVRETLRRGKSRCEARRRSRTFVVTALLWIAGWMLLSAGMKLGWFGMIAVIIGLVFLAGGFGAGLMKLRDWFS